MFEVPEQNPVETPDRVYLDRLNSSKIEEIDLLRVYQNPELTLENCFKEFAVPEICIGKNKWPCPNCKTDV